MIYFLLCVVKNIPVKYMGACRELVRVNSLVQNEVVLTLPSMLNINKHLLLPK